MGVSLVISGFSNNFQIVANRLIDLYDSAVVWSYSGLGVMVTYHSNYKIALKTKRK